MKVEVIPPRKGISPGGVSLTMKSLTLKLIKNIEAIKRGGGGGGFSSVHRSCLFHQRAQEGGGLRRRTFHLLPGAVVRFHVPPSACAAAQTHFLMSAVGHAPAEPSLGVIVTFALRFSC